MIEIIILFFTGIFIGGLVGMFGIGGGLIMVPVITFILMGFHEFHINDAVISGVATSLASIILSGFISTLSHHYNQNIDWKVVHKFSWGVVVGALFIGNYLPQIPTDLIRSTFIVYTFIAAYKILSPYKVLRNKSIPSFIVSNSIGLFFSTISGLIGIGGGTLFVPYLTSRGIGIKLAIGISSSLGLIIGLGSSITLYLSWQELSMINRESMVGAVYMPAIFFLTLPSLIFVKLSADCLQKISDKRIKIAFAYLLIAVGLFMFFINQFFL
jgi:uncharacterized protein